MIEHLSVFVENKPGKLDAITKILAEKGINLLGISVASLGEFGIIKLLTSSPDTAVAVLREHHFTVQRRKVAVVIIADRPGSLHEVLTVLAAHDINIEDCYGFVLENRKEAAIVLEVEKYPEAIDVLEKNSIKLMKG
jgi:hypothetical protein